MWVERAMRKEKKGKKMKSDHVVSDKGTALEPLGP